MTSTTDTQCGGCRETFPTLDAVFSHECSASGQRRPFGQVLGYRGQRETVANGFGGTTTRHPLDPPTEKQTAFLRKLLAERAGVDAAEAVRLSLNTARESSQLSKRTVSAAIDALLKIARPQEPTTTPATFPAAPVAAPIPDVPAGHYALEVDGTVKFYRVDRPTEGKWAGWTFVKVQASDDYYPVKGAGRLPILEAIAADPAGASTRYGIELGCCGVCNRTLTDEASRARGIGPICASKMGW